MSKIIITSTPTGKNFFYKNYLLYLKNERRKKKLERILKWQK